MGSRSKTRPRGIEHTLGAVVLAVGLASFLASFTGPEGPIARRQTRAIHVQRTKKHTPKVDSPLGCVKSPASTPVRRARLNCESKALDEVTLMVLFACTYFLMACRLRRRDTRQRLGISYISHP